MLLINSGSKVFRQTNNRREYLFTLLLPICAFVTIIIAYRILFALSWYKSMIGISLPIAALLVFIVCFLGYSRYLYSLYVLLIPMLAGFDRYRGTVLYEFPGYIVRLGITQSLLLIVTVAVILHYIHVKPKKYGGTDFLHISVIFFFVIVTTSLFYGPADWLAFRLFFSSIPYYLMAYLSARYSMNSLGQIDLIFKAMVVCVASVVISRYMYQGFVIAQDQYRVSVNYIFLSAVYYTQVLVQILPFALFFIHISKKKIRLIFIICFLLILSELLLSQTRGAYLACFLSLTYYHMNTAAKINLRNKIILFTAGILFLILFGIMLQYRITSYGKDVFSEADYYRIEHLSIYFDAFMSNFLLGLGFGAESIEVMGHSAAHNTFLSVAVDTGIIGLLSFVCIYIFCFIYTKRVRIFYQSSRYIVFFIRACEASLIGQIFHAITTGNSFLYTVPMQIIFFLFTTFAAISCMKKNKLFSQQSY